MLLVEHFHIISWIYLHSMVILILAFFFLLISEGIFYVYVQTLTLLGPALVANFIELGKKGYCKRSCVVLEG